MLKRKLFNYFVLFAMLWLTGCGNATPSSQRSFSPLRPDPTATPNFPAYSPLKDQRQPTSVVADLVPLKQYIHASSRFGITYPDNWQFFERPDGVVFIEPANQVGYSVFFSDVGEVYTPEQISQYLGLFLVNNFMTSATNFSPLDTKTEADGSMVVHFTSLDPKLGKAMNEVQLFQQKTVMFVLLINSTETQWTVSRDKLKKLVNSFKPLDTNPLPTATPTRKIVDLTLIGPTSSEFGFFYPNDWEVLVQDKNMVTVVKPDQNYTFTASNYLAPASVDDPQAAEKTAEAFVENIKKQYDNLQKRPTSEFRLDTMKGVTIDYLYQDEQGTDWAGSIIVGASKGKIYQIVFTAPAPSFENGLNWFNPMYKSFRVLDTTGLIIGN